LRYNTSNYSNNQSGYCVNYTHTNQDLIQDTPHSELIVHNVTNEYLTQISYTISAFACVSFPQQFCGHNTTQIHTHTKTVEIGANLLNVEFSGELLPSGIYPRRLLSYLCKSATCTRSKTATVKIARSRAQFYKDALGINYTPSSKDMQAISEQLRAFVSCELSIAYSNPNDKARKPRDSVKFVAGDHSWLYDDSQEWQEQITLSPDIFELIKLTAVPISAKAVAEFTNARALDIFNYLLYQNYNLHIKQLSASFHIEELYRLFGGDISSINEFRRVFNKILADIKQIIPLDITAISKHTYILAPSAECMLVQHKRKPTNLVKDPLAAINEDYKNKLKKTNSDLSVEAGCVYLAKRIQSGHVRNPHAYLRDILRNPSWYRRELEDMIQIVHKLQYQEYADLPEEQRKINARFFKDLISRTHIFSLPPGLRPLMEQLRQPGSKIIAGIPNFDYCCYVVWAYMHNRCTEFGEQSPENLIVKFLAIVCK